ncbi:hypothetical protein M5K25_012364 [Dendrobium thyrsiflorum]|uniref:Uncharacterized protein n=1 Tax=Dendrobium thyrsiflorum TaxID=117978 RepID=A0ABD0UXB3_DENTH
MTLKISPIISTGTQSIPVVVKSFSISGNDLLSYHLRHQLYPVMTIATNSKVFENGDRIACRASAAQHPKGNSQLLTVSNSLLRPLLADVGRYHGAPRNHVWLRHIVKHIACVVNASRAQIRSN